MCGRFTQSYTWRELVELYRLTQPPRNLQPRYNIAPTTTIDVVKSGEAGFELVAMRWASFRGGGINQPRNCLRPSTRGRRQSAKSRCFAQPLGAPAASSRHQDITNGAVLLAASSHISLAVPMARYCRLRGFGTNGETPRQARRF